MRVRVRYGAAYLYFMALVCLALGRGRMESHLDACGEILAVARPKGKKGRKAPKNVLVRLDSGETVVVPRGNLKLIEREEARDEQG